MMRVVACNRDQRPEKRGLESSVTLSLQEGTGRDSQAEGSYQTPNLPVPPSRASSVQNGEKSMCVVCGSPGLWWFSFSSLRGPRQLVFITLSRGVVFLSSLEASLGPYSPTAVRLAAS